MFRNRHHWSFPSNFRGGPKEGANADVFGLHQGHRVGLGGGQTVQAKLPASQSWIFAISDSHQTLGNCWRITRMFRSKEIIKVRYSYPCMVLFIEKQEDRKNWVFLLLRLVLQDTFLLLTDVSKYLQLSLLSIFLWTKEKMSGLMFSYFLYFYTCRDSKDIFDQFIFCDNWLFWTIFLLFWKRVRQRAILVFIGEEFSCRLGRVKPDVSLLVSLRLLELGVRAVKPVPNT